MHFKKMDLLYKGLKLESKIPSSVHSVLLKNEIIEDPYFSCNEDKLQWIDKLDWEYSTNFKINELKEYELILKGIDTLSEIEINGNIIFKTDNMYLEYIVDITDYLKIGDNELLVRLLSPIMQGIKQYDLYDYKLAAINDRALDGEVDFQKKVSPFLRKAPYHFGWDWGPRFVTSGIYEPIKIQEKKDFEINDVYYEINNFSSEKVQYTAHFSVLSSGDRNVELEFLVDNVVNIIQECNIKKGINELSFKFEIQNPNLWWPNGHGEQYLYDFSIKVSGIKTTTKVGVSKIIHISEKDQFGRSFKFNVNGKDIFVKGANHIPNDLFIDRITEEEIEKELQMAKFANFNMIRVWGGGIYEQEYFYKRCNELGILVWQDFMFACSVFPGTQDFIESVKKESEYQVKRLRKYSCMALFCGNNEIDDAWSKHYNWGWNYKQQHSDAGKKEIEQTLDTIFLHILKDACTRLSPSIKYIPTSPYAGSDDLHKQTHLGDDHYWAPLYLDLPFSSYLENISRFSSEYGFRSFANYNELKKVFSKEELSIKHPSLIKRERAMDGYKIIEQFGEAFIDNIPTTIEKYVMYSQVVQGLALYNTILNYRINSHFTMGSLYWQLNDVWTAPSWSTINYNGVPKISHYFVKKAYENNCVYINKNEYTFDIHAINDTSKNCDINLNLEVKNYEGDLIYKKQIEEQVNENTSKYLDTIKHCDFPQDLRYYVKVSGYIGEASIEEIILLHKIEEFKLKSPKIDVKYFDGFVEITANTFVPILALENSGEALFLENGISLEKNIKRRIDYIGPIKELKILVFGNN